MNPHLDLQSLCRRLEFAQASQNKAMAEAQARMNPESHARCERIGDPERGAFAIALQSSKTHMPIVRKIPSEWVR